MTDTCVPISNLAACVSETHEDIERSGLIARETQGRERLHRLVAEPLEAIDSWLAPYAAAWDERLARLRQHLEDDDE